MKVKSVFSGTVAHVLLLNVTGDSQTTNTLVAEDGFGVRIIQTQGNKSTDAYVFNGGAPSSSTWRTVDGRAAFPKWRKVAC